MKLQSHIDRILETENLTDALEDEDANWLLDWGIEHLPELVENFDDETAKQNVHNLMGVMRQVNHIAGEREGLDDGDLGSAIYTLFECSHQISSEAPPVSQEECIALGLQLTGKSPRETMQVLLKRFLSS